MQEDMAFYGQGIVSNLIMNSLGFSRSINDGIYHRPSWKINSNMALGLLSADRKKVKKVFKWQDNTTKRSTSDLGNCGVFPEGE